MGMTIFSPTVSRPPILALLLAPLQDLFALLASGRPMPANKRYPGPGGEAVRLLSGGATPAMDKAAWRATSRAVAATVHDTEKSLLKPARTSRLRVVRAFDPAIAPSCAGRMVISGRMADVCAELDRMAQRESPRIGAGT